MAGLIEIVVAMNAVPTALGYFLNPEYVRTAGTGWLYLNAFLVIGIPLVLGLFLVYFPSTVTSRVLRVESIAPRDSSESLYLQRVAFSALGLWFTVDATLNAVHLFSRWHLFQAMFEGRPSGATLSAIGPQAFADLITAVLQLAFGLGLILGNRGLANVLARLRA